MCATDHGAFPQPVTTHVSGYRFDSLSRGWEGEVDRSFCTNIFLTVVIESRKMEGNKLLEDPNYFPKPDWMIIKVRTMKACQ
jgi:hypothetical protein